MSKKLFVGGLSWNTTEETLREACSAYGTILSVVIVLDKETRKSRGFGFVEFTTEAEAEAAMEALNGSRLDGRNINMRPAVDNRNKRERGNRPAGNRPANDRTEKPQRREHKPRPASTNSSWNNNTPPAEKKERPQKNWSPSEDSSNFPEQNWGEDSWGADDKWGKDRRRRREGKKKKKQYKKNNRWDDWDEG